MNALQVLLTWDWQGVRGLAFFVYCIISTKCSLAWVFTGDCYTLQVQKCSHMWQVPKFCQHWTIQNFPLYSIGKWWEMILDLNAELEGVDEPEVRIDEPLDQGYWIRSKPSHYGGNSAESLTEVCRHVDCSIYYWKLIFLTSLERVLILLCYMLHLPKVFSSQPSIMCYINTWSKWYSTAELQSHVTW